MKLRAKRRYPALPRLELPLSSVRPNRPPAALAAPSHFRLPRWTLAAAVEQLGPFEPGALLLGVAEDGLPVVHDLNNPNHFTPLLTGDHELGLQTFLFHMARALAFLHHPKQIRFGLLSPVLSPWQPLLSLPHAEAVLSIYHRATDDYLGYLTAWAWQVHRRSPQQHRILLIDRLDHLVTHTSEQALWSLEWLLRNGASYGVWCFATLQTGRQSALPVTWHNIPWRPIYGHTRSSKIALLQTLQPHEEFALQTQSGWLRFSPAF